MFGFLRSRLPENLPDRQIAMPVVDRHFVSGRPILGPFADHLESVTFGMGCFWGAERKFWTLDGVFTTAVGYAGGTTRNATYQDVCSGLTGHAEVVLVVFDPAKASLKNLLKVFWESHDPTQGMRQGNDRGTQYRSVIFTHDDPQFNEAVASRDAYQERLTQAGLGPITTEIRPAPEFFYAEEYHQQYLAKNPNGYCGLHSTGVCAA